MAVVKNSNTKEAILKCMQEFIQEGKVDSISLSDIANRVGISKGTLYYYYSSKELILLDLTLRYLDDMEKYLSHWISDENEDKSIVRLFAYIFDKGAHFEGRAKMHLYLITKAFMGNEKISKIFKEKYMEWRMKIARSIKRRFDKKENVEVLAQLLLLIVDGIIVQEVVDIDDINCLELAKLLDNEKPEKIKPLSLIKQPKSNPAIPEENEKL